MSTVTMQCSLNEQVKQFLLGLLQESAVNVRQGLPGLTANIAVSLLVVVPSVALALGGSYLAEKLSNGTVQPLAIAIAVASGLLCQLGLVSCLSGLLSCFVKVIRGEKVGAFEVLGGHKRVLSLLAAELLIVPALMLGVLLFILPGFYVALRASMIPLVIADEKVGPVQAIKRSFELTKGREFEIALLIGAFALSQYAVLGVSVLVGTILPFIAPLNILIFALFAQFVLTKYYVTIKQDSEPLKADKPALSAASA